MSQKFIITLTLEEDPSDRTTPDLKVSTHAEGVDSTHFAIMAKTLSKLVIAPLEASLQVASDLAETATRAADAGVFDEDEEAE